MGKKQIKDYKFVPGLIPPDANQYPNAVNLITANKEYIIEEIIGYLTFQSGGPLSAPVARPNAVAQLTNNKEFIKEEASAYITAQQATQSVLNLVPNAHALILSNKEFIKDETEAWLDDQVTTLNPPFDSVSTYVPLKLKSDIGEFIDALLKDIRYGGNEWTINTVEDYFSAGVFLFTGSRAPEALVYEFVKGLINDYILPKVIYPSLQELSVQSIVGGTAEVSAENSVTALIDTIKDVIEDGLSAIPAYVNPTYPFGALYTLNPEKCKRDIGYIVDAYIADITGYGNAETIRTVRMYWRSGVAQIDGSRAAEVAVHVFLKSLINTNVIPRVAYVTQQSPVIAAQSLTGNPGEAGTVTAFNTLADIVIDVIGTGLSAVPAFVYNYNAAFAGYTYNATKCRRDAGYIVDSYIYDMTYGGNSSTWYVSSRYWLNGQAQVDGNRQPEILAHTFARNLINDDILINKYFASYQISTLQVIALGAAGEVGASSKVTVLSNILLNTIQTGLSALPRNDAPGSQNAGLLPNAVTLIEANKKYIAAETLALIAYNVANNIAPYVFYTYNQAKCERDISYVLEGYITDLKRGGNRQTVHNASKYWENGIAQVDGDREPEIVAHTFIRDLIDNYILENVAYASRQTLVNQYINNSITTEIFAKTRVKELTNTVIDVIQFGLTYLPATVSNRGYIKVQGFFKLKDFLLVTNTSRNVILYNFADQNAAAEVTYSEFADSDFPGFIYGTDKVTTLTFDVDTSGHMVTDNIQVFVEGKETTVRMNSIATDAMERLKVGLPQSMLDADFEYGLQPTKWQVISMMRNYPSIYEIPGTDQSVLTVVTDASASTAGVGASLITVTTSGPHGYIVGTPFTIKALANTISGFSRAEGSFLVFSVPSNTTFTYYGKSKVGTTNGQVLATTYTQLRKGSFYTGAAVGVPVFSVQSNGSSGNITTSLTSPLGADYVGFTGTVPPNGAPVSGAGINPGTQVTGVVGTGSSVNSTLTSTAEIGATSLVINNTAGILPGQVIDRGDGFAIKVTQIVSSTVSLDGTLTSRILGSTESYISQTGATNGAGVGAVFTVSRNGASYSATATTPGTGYVAGNTITILGAGLEGTTPANNATLTVATASPRFTVATFDDNSLVRSIGYITTTGLATTVSPSGGTGLTVNVTINEFGEIQTVSVNNAGNGYSVNDVITIVSGVTRGVVQGFNTGPNFTSGSGYTSGTAVATTTLGGGTGLTVNTTANPLGGARTLGSITNGGSGYGANVGVATSGGTGNGLTVNTQVDGSGAVTGVTVNQRGSGYTFGDPITINGGSGTAAFTIDVVTNREITNVAVLNGGSGYQAGDTITISGGGNNANVNIAQVTADGTIQVATINDGGLIQTVTATGTPITAVAKSFVSAVTFSEPITAQINSGSTLPYSAIATIQVDFANAHGFIPGNTLTTTISSSGSNHVLAQGSFFVEQVPSATQLRFTARAAGTVDTTATLTGTVYARPDSFYVHRPYDGGVQLGTGGPQHGASAVRMSKKYIRYQSGKGVMYNTGALFAPSYDIRSMTATATTIGSFITVVTDDTDHGCQIGAEITVNGAVTTGYNGVFKVVDVTDERTFKVQSTQVLGATTADLSGSCQMAVRTWHGATVRAGAYDDQNGMFWQYDGKTLAVGRRSSTFQIAGVVSVNVDSNLITGSNTRFTQQLSAGDRVVIKGMSHVVTQIASDTSMTVSPDFRGVINVNNVKLCKTTDIIVPQSDFNLDALNGSGPSGYNVDITKMQMIGMQYTWYGAGFIDFMLRGSDGNYTFAHRFRNSNTNTEAYMRTGNLPVRYEVINEGARDRLGAAMTNSQTTVVLEDAYWFPNNGTVMIDNEMISYTGRTQTTLTGCTRSAQLSQFVSGSSRSFTAGAAAVHNKGAGVILISNTVTPIISHWGSAFLTDGRFDTDRGYIFNYAATNISITTTRQTAFLIRLAPSVSNAIVGDLGERELLNRAQLLLNGIEITSDTGTGGIVLEGVLNPQNYPINPADIQWTGLQGAAQGGQPSFAQIAPGGSVNWNGGGTQTTATATTSAFVSGTIALGAVFSGRSISNGDSRVFITQANFNTYNSQGLAAGDAISGSGIQANTTITSINFYGNISGTNYYQITMNRAANQNVTGATNVSVQKTYNLATTSTLFFQQASWETSTAKAGTEVSDTLFPAGTFVSSATLLGYFGTNYYRVTFSQTSTSTPVVAGSTTITFKFGNPPYAQPGETVFSFVAAPGGTSTLDLTELKELTNTTLGGRGTYPNGPDVLAINVYKSSGTAVPSNIVLRWGEAQA